MFTAKCSYVLKLLPIEEFRISVTDLAASIRVHKNESRILFNMWEDLDAYLGLDRYSSEHWVGSHPSLIACDVSKQRRINWWKKRKHENKISDAHSFGLAPKESEQGLMLEFYKNFTKERGTMTGLESYPECARYAESYRLREYYLLAGNLHKWINLYNATPQDSSWIWSFFPDGEVFKQAIEDYGMEVVENYLDHFTNLKEQPGFSDRCNSRKRHRRGRSQQILSPLTDEEIQEIWMK
jgi:hypothetical protein